MEYRRVRITILEPEEFSGILFQTNKLKALKQQKTDTEEELRQLGLQREIWHKRAKLLKPIVTPIFSRRLFDDGRGAMSGELAAHGLDLDRKEKLLGLKLQSVERDILLQDRITPA
jgi:hypothetical protein